MGNRFEDKNPNNTTTKKNVKPIKKKITKKFNPTIIKKDIPINEFPKIDLNTILKNNNLNDNLNKEKNVEYILKNPLEKINNLDDLIKLAELAKIKETELIRFEKPIQRLSLIIEPLKELRDVVGLEHIKNKLVDQIIYLVYHCDEKNPPMLHTIIDGPPGTGKTKIAWIIGKIISNIGYLKKVKPKTEEKMDFTSIAKLVKDTLVIDFQPKPKEDNKKGIVKYVTRADLVGGYLGQTAMKTQKAIDDASGGVLIVDEAYSLGGKRGSEDTDSYSQECIDTLVSNLSENRSFVCIILGYSEEINSSFISKNKGMESRFPFRYSIEKYSIDNLLDILKSKIIKEGYNFSDDIFEKFKEKKPKDFKYLGRDMEILWFNIKMSYTKRLFVNSKSEKNINKLDINNGLENFFNNRNKGKEEIEYYKFYYT